MPKTKTLVRPLLAWFADHARDLPWRRTTDPYAIWISEIMLQQTQVKTVIPYWERWMHRFPNIASLAKAKLDEVLKLWEGLGYYSRARNLHQAARMLVTRPDGLFPATFEEVHALPGIGRYTAGAICSMGFNQPTPVLDGNVIRVLTRLYGIAQNPREKTTNERLWRLAEALVVQASRDAAPSARSCSNLNQALMELGATVCTPRQPQCQSCPWQRHCVARKTKRISKFPNLAARPETKRRGFIAFVILDNEHVWIRRRPAGVVNAGLWEFPNQEINGGAPDVAALAEECLGWRCGSLARLCQIKHTITRYRIELDVYSGHARERILPKRTNVRRCRLKSLETLAFSSAHRKIVNALRAKAAP